jgi:hypothetical protein
MCETDLECGEIQHSHAKTLMGGALLQCVVKQRHDPT